MILFIRLFESLILLYFDCCQKANGKEKEELAESMDKLQIGESSSSFKFRRKPVIIIVVGMAGN